MKVIVKFVLSFAWFSTVSPVYANYNPVSLESKYLTVITSPRTAGISGSNSDITLQEFNSPLRPFYQLNASAGGNRMRGITTANVAAKSSAANQGSFSQLPIQAFSQMTVFFKPTGPDGNVKVNVDTFLSAFGSNRYVSGQGSLVITRSGSGDILAQDMSFCSLESIVECSGKTLISKKTFSLDLDTSTIYELRLFAFAFASPLLVPFGLVFESGTASGYADPVFSIDRNQIGADLYGLSFSPGFLNVPFSAVPEPSSWAMMILGFFLVGAFIRREKALIHTHI